MSCHSLLACRFSAERSAVNLIGIPFYVICCFSLTAFNIFSWYLIFDSLINMCFGMFLLGFILYGTLCASWTWLFPFHIREVFNYNLFKYFLTPFLFLFFFWDPYNSNVGALMLSQKSLRLSSTLVLFSLFCSAVVISTILSSRSLIHSSSSVILLLIPSREF